jgi:hypothetical protein
MESRKVDAVETSRTRPADPALREPQPFVAVGQPDSPAEGVLTQPIGSAQGGQAGTAIPVGLLLDATRTAGMFQRSALGHLDHHAWLDRVQSDGQKLMDVLSQMGFRPRTDRPVKR